MEKTWIGEKYLVCLVVITVLCAVVFLRPSIHGNDGVLNYVYLRSCFFDGDLDFSNEYEQFDAIKKYPYKFVDKPVSGITAKPGNRYGVGTSILWFPFFLCAHAITIATNSLHLTEIAADGYTFPYVLAISVGTVFYATIGLVLLYLLGTSYYEKKYVFLSILTVLFCSPLFFYTYFHPSMSHAHSFFLVCAMLYLLDRMRERPRPLLALLLGGACGFLVTTRFQDVPYLLVPILVFVLTFMRSRNKGDFAGRMFRNIGMYGCLAGFAIAIFPQLYAWKYLNGSFFSGPTPYLEYEGFSLVKPVHFFQILFSSYHGMFFWHPLLAVGVAGLFVRTAGALSPLRPDSPMHSEKYSGLIRACVVGFMAEVYLLSCWQVWYAGASFGHRMFISSLPVIAFGFAAVYSRIVFRIKTVGIAVAIGLFTLWNFILMYQYGKNMIPHDDYVSIRLIVENLLEMLRGI